MTEPSAAAKAVGGEAEDGPAEAVTPPLKSLDNEAESIQQKGVDGAEAAKLYLESTTRITVPWNAYKHPHQCTVQLLDATHKRFDRAGHFLESGNRVFVEVKNVTTAGNQTQQFDEFLATAYSATARQWQELGDPKWEFFWVTWHPFGTLTEWSQLESPERIEAALAKHPEVLNKQDVIPKVVATLAPRVWLLLLHPRQEHLMPTRAELKAILLNLERGDA